MPARLDASALRHQWSPQRWTRLGNRVRLPYPKLELSTEYGRFFSPARLSTGRATLFNDDRDRPQKRLCDKERGRNISRRRKQSGEEDPVALKPDAVVAFSTETLSRFDAF
ncbi:hypothetical protein IscW_ISCW011127 [Ixodes scapularis]|uniref:Uncharacterized protein n=1 Tax=Ixodes scapularis TaxID=6945 RepID=B7Q738_IXOSC|nr:hypothetical protein IscW_ISCW011127 [Ixodes scapularis]|eukprot:XP_002412089.1 hypothetical protein IscW_ISCW011127 [Ixodes scapularis]